MHPPDSVAVTGTANSSDDLQLRCAGMELYGVLTETGEEEAAQASAPCVRLCVLRRGGERWRLARTLACRCDIDDSTRLIGVWSAGVWWAGPQLPVSLSRTSSPCPVITFNLSFPPFIPITNPSLQSHTSIIPISRTPHLSPAHDTYLPHKICISCTGYVSRAQDMYLRHRIRVPPHMICISLTGHVSPAPDMYLPHRISWAQDRYLSHRIYISRARDC